jgi:peptidoglycan/xylan/chitin deacetylase (PgdA/CDA1 family)
MILAYHRVAQTPTDPQLLCVSPRHFAEQLQVLRRRRRPMRLLDLASSLREGAAPDDAVVITFDDGYADNLHNAAVLLVANDVSAAVFVSPGESGAVGEFWWDELDRLLLQPGSLPRILRLEIDGQAREWDLGDAAEYSQADFEKHRAWSVLRAEAPTPRQSAYRSLHQALRPLATAARQAAIASLRAWAGATPTMRPTHARLTPAEIARLAEAGVEVGAHTLTHPVLSATPVEEQRAEIQRSKERLGDILGRPVRSFAYPYGTRKDYTAETVEIVRQAGFTCACSNFPGEVRADTDLFQLPRTLVRDWDGDEFAQRILSD